MTVQILWYQIVCSCQPVGLVGLFQVQGRCSDLNQFGKSGMNYLAIDALHNKNAICSGLTRCHVINVIKCNVIKKVVNVINSIDVVYNQ